MAKTKKKKLGTVDVAGEKHIKNAENGYVFKNETRLSGGNKTAEMLVAAERESYLSKIKSGANISNDTKKLIMAWDSAIKSGEVPGHVSLSDFSTYDLITKMNNTPTGITKALVEASERLIAAKENGKY